MWRHWYGLTQAWGSTTYDWTLGQILLRCRKLSWLPGVLGGTPPGFTVRELNWRRKRCSYPRMRGNGAASMTPASSSRPLPVTQHTGRDWFNAETVESCEGVRCRPARKLCRCPPERCRAPTHGRRQYSEWSEPSPPGGTARLEIGTPRQRHPLSSRPTSVWRQRSLSAELCGRQRAAQSFWRSGCRSRICAML